MEIGLLLKKYAGLGFASKRIKEIVLSTLNDSFSMGLSPADVELKDGEVRIRISGTRRTHFALLRQDIEKALRENLSKEGFSIHKIF